MGLQDCAPAAGPERPAAPAGGCVCLAALLLWLWHSMHATYQLHCHSATTPAVVEPRTYAKRFLRFMEERVFPSPPLPPQQQTAQQQQPLQQAAEHPQQQAP